MSDSEKETYDPLNFMKNVLKELECPVCHEYYYKNITQCMNGHSVCLQCRPKLKECPVCKGGFNNVRNHTLENVISAFLIPCKYHEEGCNETLKIPEWKEHIAVCELQDHPCPMAEEWWCSWKGKLSSLKSHISKKHGKVENVKTRMSCTEEQVSYYYFVYLTWCNEKVFKVIEVHKINGLHEVNFIVQYVGDPKKATNYIFKIEFEDQTESGYELNATSLCVPLAKIPWKNVRYLFKADNSCLDPYKIDGGSYKYNVTVYDRKLFKKMSKVLT